MIQKKIEYHENKYKFNIKIFFHIIIALYQKKKKINNKVESLANLVSRYEKYYKEKKQEKKEKEKRRR